MFEHHFGLRENPFPAGHQLKFMYPSREHMEARAHLRYGIENREPFLLITGEVGTGKTTSLYDALNEWGDRVAVALITNSALSRQEMLEEICLRFNLELPPSVSKPAALVALEKHLINVRNRGEHAVLMMDEAQNLSMDLLEEIRLLSNLEHKGEKLLQIFLVGQPELEAHLARHELRQLRQRITVHYRLNPLSPDETLGYIHHHINVAGGAGAVVFPSDTCREIYRLTHGIPREINTLASSALIAAYADSSPNVTMAHIAAVAHEGDFRSVLSSPSEKPREQASTPKTAPAAAPTPPPAAAAPEPSPPLELSPTLPDDPPLEVEDIAPGVPWLNVEEPEPELPRASEPRAPEPEPFVIERERGEISKGLLAAMRRSDVPTPAPAPAASPYVQRPLFASPPPPPPMQAPIPLPLQRSGPVQLPQMAQPDLAGLPPRLRERLERELSREEGGAPPYRNWLIAVSVLATLGIMLILMQRFGAIDVPFLRGAAGSRASHSGAEHPEGALLTPATQDPTAALIDSLKHEVETVKRPASVHTASAPGSGSAPARRVVDLPAGAKAATVPATPAHSTTPADSSATSDAIHYGVGVASFLDADRARIEKDRLTRDTTLPGLVLPYHDAGTTMYRVVLGRWPATADAEQAANALMERGLINEARVVPLPKK